MAAMVPNQALGTAQISMYIFTNLLTYILLFDVA